MSSKGKDWSVFVWSAQLYPGPPAPAKCELLDGKAGTSRAQRFCHFKALSGSELCFSDLSLEFVPLAQAWIVLLSNASSGPAGLKMR